MQGAARGWEVSGIQQKAGGIKWPRVRAKGGDNKESMWLTQSDGLTWLWIFQTAVRCVITAQWEHSQHGARHVPSWDRTEHKDRHTNNAIFSSIQKEHILNCSSMLNRWVATCFHQQTNNSIFHRHALSNRYTNWSISWERFTHDRKPSSASRESKINPCAAFYFSWNSPTCQDDD